MNQLCVIILIKSKFIKKINVDNLLIAPILVVKVTKFQKNKV